MYCIIHLIMSEVPTLGYVNLKTPGFTQRTVNPTDKASVLDTYHKVQTDIAGAERAFKRKWRLKRDQRERFMSFKEHGPEALEELHNLIPNLDQWEEEYQEEMRKALEVQGY